MVNIHNPLTALLCCGTSLAVIAKQTLRQATGGHYGVVLPNFLSPRNIRFKHIIKTKAFPLKKVVCTPKF